MKNKDIKAFAKKIIEAELILQNNPSEAEKKQAELQIEKIAEKITNYEDMIKIDEYVYGALQKKS